MATYQAEKEKDIDIQLELVAFGFTKRAQELLPTSSSYYNIPTSIVYIIAAYLREFDNFGVIHEGFRTFDNGRIMELTVPTEMEDWQCGYGTVGIDSQSDTHCEWKIKIDQLIIACFVGIASKRELDGQFQYQSVNEFYCLYASDNQCELREIWDDGDIIPMRLHSDDIIIMRLNLKRREVKWWVNDKTCGALCDIKVGENITYYLAVSGFAKEFKVTIIDFRYL